MIAMKARIFLVLALAFVSAPVVAQNAARGSTLYDSYCSGCHGHPPAGGPETVRGNPQVIRNALNTVAAMRFMRDSLSDSDIVDIAAYLGTLAGIPPEQPANTSYQGLWLRTPFD